MLQSLESDIYEPMWWIDSSLNSRVILDSFLFPNCKLQNPPKNYGWIVILFGVLLIIHTKDCSLFGSKHAHFQKRKKNEDCPRVETQIKSTQHIGTYMSLRCNITNLSKTLSTNWKAWTPIILFFKSRSRVKRVNHSNSKIN